MFTLIRYVTGAENPIDSHPKSILIPKFERPLGKIEVIKDSKFTIPIDDEDAPEEYWATKEIREFVVNKVLKSSLLFPIHDDAKTWNNIEEAKQVRTHSLAWSLETLTHFPIAGTAHCWWS
jgi:hypothetical protein